MLVPCPLNNVNTLELLKKIESFKTIDLKTATMEEISLKSLETLSCMLVSEASFQEMTRLYRIRRLRNGLADMPRVFQDIWYPTPAMVTTDERANLKGQPMLYTSTEQLTPVYECGINKSDYYVLIQYTIKPGQSLHGYGVGGDFEPNDLTETGKINNKIINDFILSEFSKPVGKGTEYLYKISNVICQNFLDLPHCDAYVYPSIAHHKKGWNVAIKPASADQKIAFDCALICVSKGFSPNGEYIFEVKHKANALDGNTLVYAF